MSLDDQKLEIEITIDLAKIQNPARRRQTSKPAEPEPLRIPRITRLMALAIKFQDMVDRGEVRVYADLARLGYVSRARLTQIMNLLHLAPTIQEELLQPERIHTRPQLTETRLRPIAAMMLWADQLEALNGEPAAQAGRV